MKNTVFRILLRWFMNGLGIWAAARLLPGIEYDYFATIVVAALIFSLINATIRPIVVIFSLPAILITLGFFMLIVNAFMVYLTSVFYEPFIVRDFGSALLAAIIIGLVNYILSTFVDDKRLYVQPEQNGK